MKVISKKISYDNLVSRIPGVIPSIMDSWKITHLVGCSNSSQSETFYSYSQAVKHASDYNVRKSNILYDAEFVDFNKENLRDFSSGNYGLIPSDIIIPPTISIWITDYTDIYVNIPDNNGGFYDLSWPKSHDDPHYEGRKIISGNTEIKVLTYYTLNKWYTFFRKYHNLIGKYDTAVEYYEATYDIKDPETESEFSEMDEIYESRGGRVMYEWITQNCIVQYDIPSEFSNEWDVTFLYYPQAIQWYWWFYERNDKYENIEYVSDCKNADDCEDCKKYMSLGGKKFFNSLSQWIQSVDATNSQFATKSASIVIPISITNSIDDLGEMTIFSTEWEEEVDYHNTLSNSPGTVVNRPYETDNDTGEKSQLEDVFVIKNGDSKGYIYNEYKENVFNPNDWTNYTYFYMNSNPEKFISTPTAYTFSPINDKIIYNPEEISESYKIVSGEIVCINGNIYDVIDGDYVQLCYSDSYIASVKYKNNTKLQVFKDGNLEYAMMNGKRMYVETDEMNVKKIYFLKDSICNDKGCNVQSGKYIIFNNTLYLLEDDNKSVVISDDMYYKIYPVLNGYIDYNGNTFYISGNTVVIPNDYEYDEVENKYEYSYRELDADELNAFNIKSINVNGNAVVINYNFNKKICDTISGYSDSKLDLLRRKEITTDDLGNELPGHFRSVVDIPMKEVSGKQVVDVEVASGMSHYNLPYDECVLDILYKVGDVSGLEPLDEEVFGENTHHGNIITNIEFYYADAYKNHKISSSTTKNSDDALEVIKWCEERFEESDDETIINQMLCDITYCIGATIKKTGREYSLMDDLHCGVKYVDTVFVNKKTGVYNMWSNKKFTYAYYSLAQNVQNIYLSDFNDTVIWDVSYFEFKPLLYKNNDGEVSPQNDLLFSGWSEYNNSMASPVFRTEFNLGSSLPQIVDGDIYTDRGINSAFEKHLKLQEIKTMEALTNYGLSYFKINKY